MLYVALVLNTGPDMGWFSYVPLAGPDYIPGKRSTSGRRWSRVEVSTLPSAVEIITTVFKQRARGDVARPRAAVRVVDGRHVVHGDLRHAGGDARPARCWRADR